MVQMNYDKLPKRAETKRQEGSRKQGRPQLRWEDCVNRDLRKAKEEEKWREKANNRDRWKLITKAAVLRSDQYTSLTPTQGKQEEEQVIAHKVGIAMHI